MRAIDPTVAIEGSPVTTLLHRVCDEDPGKFEEATRIVELFIRAAIGETDNHGGGIQTP